jgi:uncharacterized protein (UPF0548 family)
MRYDTSTVHSQREKATVLGGSQCREVLSVRSIFWNLIIVVSVWTTFASNLHLFSLCHAKPASFRNIRRPLTMIRRSIQASTIAIPDQLPRRFTPNKITRCLQSWVIRQGPHERNSQRMGRTRAQRSKASAASNLTRINGQRHGSFLTLARPTKDAVYGWFGVNNADESEVLRCMLSRHRAPVFNHQYVGITNPVLHIHHHDPSGFSTCADVRGRSNDESYLSSFQVEDTVHDKQTSRSTVSVMAKQGQPNECWPSLLVSPNTDSTSATHRNCATILSNAIPYLAVRRKEWQRLNLPADDWRVLAYRMRVGMGANCYEQVRDALLDWEFHSSDGSMGLVEIPNTPPRGLRIDGPNQRKMTGSSSLSKPYVPSATSRYSIRPVDMPLPDSNTNAGGSFHRSLGSTSRRLVSYTSLPLRVPFLSKVWRRIYAVNPVMVIYDVVDQRGHDMLWTSTAYATMKGHWLSGEERVTIVMRDGSQAVDVEILSVSRAGPSLWGKIVWPLVGKKQNAFFTEQLLHLQKVAAKSLKAQAPLLGSNIVGHSCTPEMDYTAEKVPGPRKLLFGERATADNEIELQSLTLNEI